MGLTGTNIRIYDRDIAGWDMHRSRLIAGQSSQRGFSLLEMAVVMVVLGLILGGMLLPLSTQLEKQDRDETQLILEDIHEALVGFAMANGRLPCPDITLPPDGIADLAATCAGSGGSLPWVDLGVGQFNAWGQPFTYRVTVSFADNTDGTGCGVPTPGVSFELCSSGDINVLNAAPPPGAAIASLVPAIVISHGKNWASMTSLAAAGADEWENRPNDTNFVDTTYSKTSGGGNPTFDDQVIWISPNILKARMVAAGQLP